MADYMYHIKNPSKPAAFHEGYDHGYANTYILSPAEGTLPPARPDDAEYMKGYQEGVDDAESDN